jgi:hypothetical protein
LPPAARTLRAAQDIGDKAPPALKVRSSAPTADQIGRAERWTTGAGAAAGRSQITCTSMLLVEQRVWSQVVHASLTRHVSSSCRLA